MYDLVMSIELVGIYFDDDEDDIKFLDYLIGILSGDFNWI